MKTNHDYHWTITLIGRTKTVMSRCKGDIEDALHAADVEESNVPFTVLAYHIARGARVKKRRVLTTKHTKDTKGRADE